MAVRRLGGQFEAGMPAEHWRPTVEGELDRDTLQGATSGPSKQDLRRLAANLEFFGFNTTTEDLSGLRPQPEDNQTHGQTRAEM